MQQVDPPDLAMLPTLRRLLRLWWEQGRWVALGLGLRARLHGALARHPGAHPARHRPRHRARHTSRLWPYVAAILALSLVRFVVNFTRRYATARIGVHSRPGMRELLYDGYLSFPRAFYDRHPTGQVVSRATNDLYPDPLLHRLGHGAGRPERDDDRRRRHRAGAGRPAAALYTGRRDAADRLRRVAVRPSRDADLAPVQARKGDVTEAADEAVVGIEMVQAFGREDDVRDRFGEQGRPVRDVVCARPASRPATCRRSSTCPTLSIAAVVFFGGRDVIAGTLTIGQFVLFNTILLQLAWPLEALGWIMNLAQRALASAGRSSPGSSCVAPAAGARAIRRRSRRGPLAVAFDGVRFAYAGEEEVLRGVDLALAPGEIVAVCGAHRRGQEHAAEPAAALLRPHRRPACSWAASTCATFALAELRAAVAVVTQRPILFSVHAARQPDRRPP